MVVTPSLIVFEEKRRAAVRSSLLRNLHVPNDAWMDWLVAEGAAWLSCQHTVHTSQLEHETVGTVTECGTSVT